MLGNEHKEFLEDGKVLLYARNGIYYARVYKGDRSYVYRTLKTRKLAEGKKLAVKFLHEIEFRLAENLPIQQKTLNEVIDEYVALRQKQHDRGEQKNANATSQQHTSESMLYQIKRVVKFWREYCGKMAVDKIDNAVLQDYIPWRKDYYGNMPADKVPKQAKPNPADQTLAWETILAKTLLKFAHERGYRGKAQLPTWRYIASNKITRPTFTKPEYISIILAMRRWIAEEKSDKERRYTRELLRDYVLILANSGIRVGEANNLKVSDVVVFVDGLGRKNYSLNVKGKTGSRMVVPRTGTVGYIERVLTRIAQRKEEEAQNIERQVRTQKRKVSDKDNWFFCMYDGEKIITLIDQFKVVLEKAGLSKTRYGETYSLYSLRHFYAVTMLRKGVPVFDIARNMGTSVQIIDSYYGKSAIPMTLAITLGGIQRNMRQGEGAGARKSVKATDGKAAKKKSV